MQLKTLLNGISGIIQDGISVKDFSMVAKTDTNTAERILEDLAKNQIGAKKDGMYFFAKGDKLKFALMTLEKGATIEEVSEKIDWKDFEGLVGEILRINDFAVVQNLVLTKPRMEIDIIGIKMGLAMLIDCKHWKKTSFSAMQTVVQKQIDRTKHYIAKTPGAIAVPVIVTLYQDRVDFIKKVPIVPIHQFASFVDEFYGNLDQMKEIKA